MDRWTFAAYERAMRACDVVALADYFAACARGVGRRTGLLQAQPAALPKVPVLAPHVEDIVSPLLHTHGVVITHADEDDDGEVAWEYRGPYGVASSGDIPTFAHAVALAAWDEAAPDAVWTVRSMKRSEHTLVYMIADGYSGVYDHMTSHFQSLHPKTVLLTRTLPFETKYYVNTDLNDTLCGFALLVGPVIIAMQEMMMFGDDMSSVLLGPLVRKLQQQHPHLIGWNAQIRGEGEAWQNAGFVQAAHSPTSYLWNVTEADAQVMLDRLGVTHIGKQMEHARAGMA